MKGPTRLRERDDLAATLLGAARAYRPTDKARRRTLAALGLPLTASIVGSAAAPAATASSAIGSSAGSTAIAAGTSGATTAAVSATKVWLAVGAVAAAGGGATVTQHVLSKPRPVPSAMVAVAKPAPRRPNPPPRLATIEVGPAPAPVAVAPVATPIPVATDELPPPPVDLRRPPRPRAARPRPAVHEPAPSTTVQERVAPAVVAPSSAPATAPPPVATVLPPAAVAPPAPRARSLAPELALIRAADAALRAGRPAEALARLDEHERTFLGGVLGDEAAVLRVAALVRQGDRLHATAFGEGFLRKHPRGLLADRVRLLLRSPVPQTFRSSP